MLSSAYMSWISFSSADQKTKANTSLDRSIFFFFCSTFQRTLLIIKQGPSQQVTEGNQIKLCIIKKGHCHCVHLGKVTVSIDSSTP